MMQFENAGTWQGGPMKKSLSLGKEKFIVLYFSEVDKIRLNSIMGSAKKIDVLLSNTNTNPNPKINVVAMTKEHQFFYGTDTRGKPIWAKGLLPRIRVLERGYNRLAYIY